ncbi:Uncharacterised protein [Legionella lansingensis]|uniref:Uncharacterized protein n=1 Tax=Legionella lansingensis TaxID=45067 RepID=A0A0W0VZW0_9GAMM|nr:hypothetical protein [Legionella lansingensis]KTD25728.1 hypothetical protein Llan_0118 [Legionella lansingensis]SNV49277.1 Uncharacterised protein [Legionella lansingensis]
MFAPSEFKTKEFKGLLAKTWSPLEELNKELKKLQNEVHNDELEMTIALIDEVSSFKKSKSEIVLQYLSVVMLEVAYSLANIKDEHHLLSNHAREALEEINYITKHFETMFRDVPKHCSK